MISYLLMGFGYKGVSDLKTTLFTQNSGKQSIFYLSLSGLLAALRTLLFDYTGLDLAVFMAFIVLLIAEFFTGLKVARRKRNERFQSRKMGRMILKIGVYMLLIALLHAFAEKMAVPALFGMQINPFVWLYHAVFMAIVFQLFISWLENLGALGYKETHTLIGLVLRKFNKWFEFDGSKNNGPE